MHSAGRQASAARELFSTQCDLLDQNQLTTGNFLEHVPFRSRISRSLPEMLVSPRSVLAMLAPAHFSSLAALVALRVNHRSAQTALHGPWGNAREKKRKHFALTLAHLHLSIFICTFTLVRLHLCIYTCAFTPVHLHFCAYTCAFTIVRLHLCAYTCAFTLLHLHLHAYTCRLQEGDCKRAIARGRLYQTPPPL